MNRVQLSPEIAESLRFQWLGGGQGMLLEPILPDDFDAADVTVRAVLPGFLSVGRWKEIVGLTEAIHLHRSYGTDLRGVIFHNPSNADDARQVGFSIEDGTDNELLLDEAAFMALAARWLGALRTGALESSDPATAEPWWPEWAASVAAIECNAATDV